MCGIYAALCSASCSAERVAPSQTLRTRLVNRGPDHFGCHDVSLAGTGDDEGIRLSLSSTVLSLRGSHIVPQPLISEDENYALCWNGEAWRLRGEPVSQNDGLEVLDSLRRACESADGRGEGPEDVLRAIEGPFAFVFYWKKEGRLYFGRDRLGRRSLLIQKQDECLRLSSVADEPNDGWEEVEADGFYSIDVRPSFAEAVDTLTRHTWAKDEDFVSAIGVFNEDLPSSIPVPLTLASPSVQLLRDHLTESLRHRVLNVPCPPGCGENGARVAVLFSGGLDCTVLARLADEIVPQTESIDLINVAFENPRLKAQQKDQDTNMYELCPDRVTGRASFAELATVCPDRVWRFVAVDVPYSETTTHRSDVVRLIHPHQTEMDLSIAYALYFAARGIGTAHLTPLTAQTSPSPYHTTARVLLSGLGADELFGGYTRHATAFSRGGHAGLAQELKLDVSRLGKRNLGRDDRVMSNWGREVRFPFLDEKLVKWAVEAPAWEKCDFGSAEGKEEDKGGERPEAAKRVLRLVAQSLGMKAVALEKKRAIQFGARTAKMESGKTKGTTTITA